MAFTIIGPRQFQASRDSEGHREYRVTYLVVSTSNQDGPQQAMVTPGLPAIGSTYAYGNEVDLWAWCRPDIQVSPAGAHAEGDFPFQFLVTCLFSTKPREQNKERPQGSEVADPLSEPQKVSGASTRDREEAILDRHGKMIRYSTFERIRGAQNEWEVCHHTVTIEQNVPDLQPNIWGPMQNTVNQSTLWGLPPRSIKLGPVAWRKNYGKYNSVYYTRTFPFDIRLKKGTITRGVFVQLDSGSPVLLTVTGSISQADVGRTITGTGIPTGTTIVSVTPSNTTGQLVTLSNAATASSTLSSPTTATITGPSGSLVGDWDRDIGNESSYVIIGHWDTTVSPPQWVADGTPSPNTPTGYQRFPDIAGSPKRMIISPLTGKPWDPDGGETEPSIRVEKYDESNFLLLGIPTTI